MSFTAAPSESAPRGISMAQESSLLVLKVWRYIATVKVVNRTDTFVTANWRILTESDAPSTRQPVAFLQTSFPPLIRSNLLCHLMCMGDDVDDTHWSIPT